MQNTKLKKSERTRCKGQLASAVKLTEQQHTCTCKNKNDIR